MTDANCTDSKVVPIYTPPEVIDKLSDVERLALQSLLAQIDLEKERIEKYKILIDKSNMIISLLENDLARWKAGFNAKYRDSGLTVENVEINTQTGVVTPCKK